MNLKFKKIIVNNFFSYCHEELQLNDMGYAIVTGHNNNPSDNAQSNGSGKSSIFNAVCYALTGETAQGLKTNIENIYGDPNDCWVELHLDVDNDSFVIRRFRTPRSDLKLWINGSNVSGKGIKESTDLLKQYLPDLTSMLLGSIIILGQGLPYKFTTNHPSGRKELLEKLTKSDYMIQSIREKLDIRQEELRVQLRSQEDSLVANNTQQEIFSKQLDDYNKELNDIISYNSEYTLDDRLVYLKDKLSKIEDNIKLKDELSKQLLKTVDDTNDLKSKLLLESSTKRDELVEPTKKELSKYNVRKVELTTTINNLKNEIKKLKKVSDICPTCGQKIPGAHKVDTTDKENELNKYNEELKQVDLLINKLEKEKDEIDKNFSVKFNSSIDEYDKTISTTKNNLTNINSELSELTAKKQKTITEQLKVQNMKDNYNKLDANVKDITLKLEELVNSKLKIEADVNDSNDHLRVIQNLITLTKKEFRGILLENVIIYINKKVKQYSYEVFNNDLLSFELNDNYIDIKYADKYYESLSGGEKQKVDIIIQLALRDLLSSQLGIRSNMIILDEIFDNLDAVGCQKVIDLISKIQDIESVFIISHHASELQISYDTEIVVDKDINGISTISIR